MTKQIVVFHNNRLFAEGFKSLSEAKKYVLERDHGPFTNWKKQIEARDGRWFEHHYGGPSNAYEIRVGPLGDPTEVR